MAGKKFKFRSDGNRRVGVKEVINRNMSIRGPRISVSVCLDKDFNLSKVHHIEDNILVSAEEKVLKKGKGSKPIYYPIDSMSYIATIIFQFNNKNKLIEKSLILYMPNTICSFDEIYCNRVTSTLSKEDREIIMNNISNFALSRV